MAQPSDEKRMATVRADERRDLAAFQGITEAAADTILRGAQAAEAVLLRGDLTPMEVADAAALGEALATQVERDTGPVRREVVEWFANLMEQGMTHGDGVYGPERYLESVVSTTRPAWVAHLERRVATLKHIVIQMNDAEDWEKIRVCVNVANFAMMLADKVRKGSM